ncbi:hypothetical protein K505DRAFT_369087 [Melanomma pulvis-pyrius CBS 109.77]|uniref:Uncharacterized protein n=1 Tax=Melanomma pulvis-pyrius CBS 109.77 TaxID=1314802 RepID=A0A6A6WNL5_9PLEO|nr:hypothetical protein K505DRAFT_369087 [Melanomma pulvis-pyrius CBS 109.77]
MPKRHIFKNLWQDSKQARTNVDGSEKTVQEDQGEEVPDTPPPRYTEFPSKDDSRCSLLNSNTPYPLLTKVSQLSRYLRRGPLVWSLVEIIALTFSTDCQRLKAALVKADPTWAPTACIQDSSSIRNDQGRAIVTEFSALIQNLQKEMSHDRWLLVCGRDKNLMKKLVLEPVKDLDLNLDYALEVLGRYKRVEGCRRPESTLVDYWMLSSSSTDLGDTIASHALLLQSFELETEVHLILEDSITTYQKEKGLEELRTSKEMQEESVLSLAKTCCWPLSDEYMDLARGLRGLQKSGEMHDPFEPSRTRLRESRKLREHGE